MSLLRRSTFQALLLAKTLHKPLAAAPTRSIKRWVAPTLSELWHRKNKLGPQPEDPRSSFPEWNYRAELFAFGKRLHEEFQLPLLQTAFTQRSYVMQEEQRQRELGIDADELQMPDNRQLAAQGEQLAKQYIEAYLQHALPNVPAEGRASFTNYLLSETTLADIGYNLGMKDLILAAEYPPTAESLAQALRAVIGALAESSGEARAYGFVRDFICTQLNQRDLLDLWQIEEPEALLRRVCAERQMQAPEARLLGDCGKNTILAAYHVGMYANKQMLGKGFGEDVATAIHTASLDALQTLFGMRDNMRPFDFQLQVTPKAAKLT